MIKLNDKGIPRRDGSGKGRRDNINRGGCNINQLNGRRLANRRPRRGWREINQR